MDDQKVQGLTNVYFYTERCSLQDQGKSATGIKSIALPMYNTTIWIIYIRTIATYVLYGSGMKQH